MKRDTRLAAERVGLKPKTLENWRCQGNGPPFYKVGARVVYDDADVDAWMRARRRTSTSRQAQEAAQ
jgi:hypothetical protein